MDRLSVTIDVQVNDIGSKQVSLRSSLVVANLIGAVQDKYNLDGKFQVRLQDARRPLAANCPLDQAGVTDGSILVFSPLIEATGTKEAIQRGAREKFSKKYKRVYLQEERLLTEFDLGWHPAIIGRKDRRDPSKNKMLAVDLGEFEESPTVSHHHACITENEGAFFLESISESNPTYVGDTRLRPGARYPLPAGSMIRAGRVSLSFYIVT